MDLATKIVGKFAGYGYNIGEEEGEAFQEYLRYLVEYNDKVNLTAITGEDEIIVKHFLDSLAATDYIPSGACLADIGSGAGFPAMVLKLHRPDIDLTLFESNGKKVVFLTSLIAKLGVAGAKPLKLRAEEAGRKDEFRAAFDVVTARAVTETRILLEYAMPLLKAGGELIAYKAHCEEEIAAAKGAAAALGAVLKEVKEFEIDGQYRTLVRYVKVKDTPERYPRRNAKIEKEPL